MRILADQTLHHLRREERTELRLSFLQRSDAAHRRNELDHQFGKSQVATKVALFDVTFGDSPKRRAPNRESNLKGLACRTPSRDRR